MKYNKLLIHMFVFVLLTISSFACSGPMLTYHIKSLDENNKKVESYRYPDFKQDDFLIIDKIKLENKNGCGTIPPLYISFYFKFKNETKNSCFITTKNIIINETYEINLSELSRPESHILGGSRYTCELQPKENGEWQVTINARNMSNTLEYEISSYIEYDNIITPGNRFRVVDKQVYREREVTKKSLWFGLAGTFIGAIITLLGTLYFEKEKYKTNKTRAIKAFEYEAELNRGYIGAFIENKKKMLKNKEIPSMTFITLNAERIIKSDYIEDSELRDDIVGYYQGLIAINRLLDRSLYSGNRLKIDVTKIKELSKKVVLIKIDKILNKLSKDK